VVTRLDRLARSTSELLRIAERLTEKSAGLQSLDEPWADTTSPSERMVMTIFAGIADDAERAVMRSDVALTMV
jgi:DNA invertase Pin-like site-specific DNA recombinase